MTMHIDFSRFDIVDYNEEASIALFRSNLPMIEHAQGWKFEFDIVCEYCTRLLQNKLRIPQALTRTSQLEIISLLDSNKSDQRPPLEEEEAWTKLHNVLYCRWPIQGMTDSRATQDTDGMFDKIKYMQSRVMNPKAHPHLSTSTTTHLHHSNFTHDPVIQIILLHCGQGQDRTGQMAAAYQLYMRNHSTYLPSDLTYAQVLNEQLARGMDVPENLNALEWFAHQIGCI